MDNQLSPACWQFYRQRSLLFGLLLATTTHVLAQQPRPALRIGTGTSLVGSGAVQLVYGGGTLFNNGSLSLAAGQLTTTGSTTYQGTGTATVANLSISTGTLLTGLLSLFSVTNQVTISAGTNFNTTTDQLYLRTDQFAGANLVNNGNLTGTIQGLVTNATVRTGATAYSSQLSVNVSGSSMKYQWQRSADNSVWTDVTGATGATYTASVTSPIYYRNKLTGTTTGYTQTTPGVLLAYTGSLPVTLAYFNGRMTDAGGLLAWATAREDHNAHFQIERSRKPNVGAGLAFESIGTVPSQAPEGNSLTELTYGFIDAQPLPGVNYYRLMQTDRDGTRTQAGAIIALSRENQPPVLFPNPLTASGEATIEPAITHSGYQITDVLGRVVQRQDAPGVLSRVNVSGLPAGVYLLRVQTDAGVTTWRVLR